MPGSAPKQRATLARPLCLPWSSGVHSQDGRRLLRSEEMASRLRVPNSQEQGQGERYFRIWALEVGAAELVPQLLTGSTLVHLSSIPYSEQMHTVGVSLKFSCHRKETQEEASAVGARGSCFPITLGRQAGHGRCCNEPELGRNPPQRPHGARHLHGQRSARPFGATSPWSPSSSGRVGHLS